MRLLWQTPTHRGIQLLAQAHQWNAEQTEDQEPCEVCQKELKEHDLRTFFMRARVWSDFWGWFTVQLSNPKESLDRCPVDPRNHSHQTLKELKECFFKKKPMFESSRRVEWQLLLRGLRLTEAEEPCSKCGCFWRDHDPVTCHGVGTREDNLWVVHEHFYPQILRILKEIVATCGAADNPPCPVCDDEANHDWLECLRMA